MALKKGEQLMKLNLCFKLPKNFKGDLNDALDLLVAYRRAPKKHKKQYKMDPTISPYENWFQMVQETDRSLCGAVSISKFDGKVFVDRDDI